MRSLAALSTGTKEFECNGPYRKGTRVPNQAARIRPSTLVKIGRARMLSGKLYDLPEHLGRRNAYVEI